MKVLFFDLLLIFLFLNGSYFQRKGNDKITVQTIGALKTIVQTGDISAKVNLDTLQNIPHLYALGALENLSGEITIIDGEPFISQDINNESQIDHKWDHKATLLVYASVYKWKSVNIPDSVKTLEQLDTFAGKAAEASGISPDDPFPFMLEGTARSFSWHIVKWKIGDMEHSHEKHQKSGLHGTMNNEEVEIIGFYSQHHQGIFTHHGTNIHTHVNSEDNSIAGHLDDIVLGEGMVLKIPDTNN